MKLTKVLSLLQAGYDPILLELLQPHWANSVANEPRDWKLLQRAHWQEYRAWCDCGPQVDVALDEVTARIAANPALRLLAWHCCQLIFEWEDYNRFKEWITLVPLLESIQLPYKNTFFLLLALGAVPRLCQRNMCRNVPEEVTRGTLKDIAIAVRRFARYNKDAVGVEPRKLGWIRLVASGELYRIGRFEYVVQPFHARLRVYRHRTSGRVLALSEPDVDYNATGHLLLYDSQGEFPLPNQTPAWTSTFHESTFTIRGHAISPHGFAQAQLIELKAAEWKLVLARGDNVLIVHIPDGATLTPEICRTSFEQAHAFFTARFSGLSLRAFVTNSWMFNTQLEMMLPPMSNILAWQREVYLYPEISTGNDGLYFVFNSDRIDPVTAPRDTALRRAMTNHLSAGNSLRSGGMFILFDDLPHYGTQVYRAMQE